MLKKMVKEAEKITSWQETIFTALHNIDASWVVSGVFILARIPNIDWGRISANFPRTIADLLSDHNLAHHGLGTIVPHDALASLTEKAHGSLTNVTSDQHHARSHDHSNALDGSPIAEAGVPNHMSKNKLAFTLNKLLKGAGPDADPTEIDVPAAGVPSGLIAMWHGTIANIPAGWVICDGNNSTPNLLARFVEMVPNLGTDPGATGGATAKTTSGHTHTGPSHTHTGPSHTHTVDIYASNKTGSLLTHGDESHNFIQDGDTTRDWDSTMGPATHQGAGKRETTVASGTGATGADGTGATGSKTDSILDIRPKYYDVAFIMKT